MQRHLDHDNNCNSKDERKLNSAMGIADIAASNVQALRSMDEATELGPSFSPGELDVICARGSRAFQHEGNRRFREMVTSKMDEYSSAASKFQKSMIVSQIVDDVRQNSPNGGFVKDEKGRWFEVGDGAAREKVGQLLRDLLHAKYKSSTKAKRQRLLMKQGICESDGEEGETVGNISVEAKVQQISRAGRNASSKSSPYTPSCSKEHPNHCLKQQGSMHEELLGPMNEGTPRLLMKDASLLSSSQQYHELINHEPINLEPIDFEHAMNVPHEPLPLPLLGPSAPDTLFEPEQEQHEQCYPRYQHQLRQQQQAHQQASQQQHGLHPHIQYPLPSTSDLPVRNVGAQGPPLLLPRSTSAPAPMHGALLLPVDPFSQYLDIWEPQAISALVPPSFSPSLRLFDPITGITDHNNIKNENSKGHARLGEDECQTLAAREKSPAIPPSQEEHSPTPANHAQQPPSMSNQHHQERFFFPHNEDEDKDSEENGKPNAV